MTLKHGIDITVRYVPGVGWAFRVVASKKEDWSGNAPSLVVAWELAMERARDLGVASLPGGRVA